MEIYLNQCQTGSLPMQVKASWSALLLTNFLCEKQCASETFDFGRWKRGEGRAWSVHQQESPSNEFIHLQTIDFLKITIDRASIYSLKIYKQTINFRNQTYTNTYRYYHNSSNFYSNNKFVGSVDERLWLVSRKKNNPCIGCIYSVYVWCMRVDG